MKKNSNWFVGAIIFIFIFSILYLINASNNQKSSIVHGGFNRNFKVEIEKVDSFPLSESYSDLFIINDSKIYTRKTVIDTNIYSVNFNNKRIELAFNIKKNDFLFLSSNSLKTFNIKTKETSDTILANYLKRYDKNALILNIAKFDTTYIIRKFILSKKDVFFQFLTKSGKSIDTTFNPVNKDHGISDDGKFLCSNFGIFYVNFYNNDIYQFDLKNKKVISEKKLVHKKTGYFKVDADEDHATFSEPIYLYNNSMGDSDNYFIINSMINCDNMEREEYKEHLIFDIYNNEFNYLASIKIKGRKDRAKFNDIKIINKRIYLLYENKIEVFKINNFIK